MFPSSQQSCPLPPSASADGHRRGYGCRRRPLCCPHQHRPPPTRHFSRTLHTASDASIKVVMNALFAKAKNYTDVTNAGLKADANAGAAVASHGGASHAGVLANVVANNADAGAGAIANAKARAAARGNAKAGAGSAIANAVNGTAKANACSPLGHANANVAADANTNSALADAYAKTLADAYACANANARARARATANARLEHLDAGHLRRLADHVLHRLKAAESWTCRCTQK